jgi:hypothetical protein
MATPVNQQEERNRTPPSSPSPVANQQRSGHGDIATRQGESYYAEAPVRTIFTNEDELNSCRREFWESRVDGNAMVWMTLHSAADALLANDLQLSSAILSASGITAPNGTLELCYDETGREYKIPSYCYTTELLLPPTTQVRPKDSTTEIASIPKSHNEIDLHLKVRVNPGDHNMIVDIYSRDTIGILKQRILEKSMELSNAPGGFVPICAISRQRMMFMGKEMKNDGMLLIDAKMDESKVVQIFLKPTTLQ